MTSEMSAPRASPRGLLRGVLAGTLLLAMAQIRIRRLPRRVVVLLDAVATVPHDRWLWRSAGVLSLTLHGIGIAFAVRAAMPNEAPDPGVAAFEIRLESTAPQREAADLSPQPEVNATAAVEKAIIDPTKWLKAVPTETKNPNLTVSPEATNTPHQDETTAKVSEETLSRGDVASEGATALTIDTREAQHSAAPVPGTGKTARRIQLAWEKQLLAHLARHKRYPTEAARPTGQVILTFVLDRAGHVVSATVLKGSSDAAMDQAALAMLQRSDPVPPPPPLVADAGLSFTIPVLFRAKQTKQ